MRKIKNYEEIQGNKKPSFEILYYNCIRAIKELHKDLNPEPKSKIDITLNRLQQKLEQMTAKWKHQRNKENIQRSRQ